ncbi:AMIN domain-containing protein [Streptomyces sp. NBC_00250]|uniref:AMIN-like domain-containing (lipo)protein n=1 Tax=Streptomyces sp. NBC_00250 TaxID=2903641 RepID=UPI002E2C5D98|nr:hypothetical protein [Streptomyces sp. NBC_00250]
MHATRRALSRLIAPAAAVLATVTAAPTASAAPPRAAVEVCDDICVDGVRAATHADHDRVVFDLGAGPLPTVEAHHSPYSEFITPGGEPKYLTTPGDSYLFLSLKNAGDGDFATTNPRVETFNLPTVKASQFLFDTDAILGFSPAIDFGITLNGPVSSYRVFTLTQPNRVVVDIYR